MKAYEVIRKRVERRGISVSGLARRVGMAGDLLRKSLYGSRKISSDEIVHLCVELELDISEFVPAGPESAEDLISP